MGNLISCIRKPRKAEETRKKSSLTLQPNNVVKTNVPSRRELVKLPKPQVIVKPLVEEKSKVRQRLSF